MHATLIRIFGIIAKMRFLAPRELKKLCHTTFKDFVGETSTLSISTLTERYLKVIMKSGSKAQNKVKIYTLHYHLTYFGCI